MGGTILYLRCWYPPYMGLVVSLVILSDAIYVYMQVRGGVLQTGYCIGIRTMKCNMPFNY